MNVGDLLSSVDTKKVGDVVALVIDNREVIAKLGQLPQLLDRFADSLSGAGGEAKNAASLLIGGDGQSGATGALDGASNALASIVESLGKGIGLIDAAAAATAKVPLMGGPAEKLAQAATEMGESTQKLTDLAQCMADIAQVLSKVGYALDKVGTHLEETGAQAQGFMAK